MKKFFVLVAMFAVVASSCNKNPEPTQEEKNVVVIDGVKYKTVTFDDGSEWMAEPLRFVPKGVTVSSDPSSADAQGVFYPYKVVDGAPVACIDAETVAKKGLLYSPAVAFGVDELTDENYKTFEGKQGICPEGWHIPTRVDWFSLVGESTKAEDEEADPTKDTKAYFWDAELEMSTVVKANAAGFNFTFSGAVIGTAYNKLAIDNSVSDVEEYMGENRMSYILSSTGYKGTSTTAKPQVFAVMSAFTKANLKGKLSLGYCNAATAVQVRCVKDSPLK